MEKRGKTEEQAIELGGNEGGRKESDQRLSSGEMESLVAICDTLLPSINHDSLGDVDQATTTFYHSSASMAGTPELVS